MRKVGYPHFRHKNVTAVMDTINKPHFEKIYRSDANTRKAVSDDFASIQNERKEYSLFFLDTVIVHGNELREAGSFSCCMSK